MSQFNIPNIPDTASILEEARQRDIQRQAEIAGRFDAKEIYEHLVRRIVDFQAKLDDKHELGIQLANYGVAAQLHVRSIGYKNPNLIEFYGAFSDGQEALLTQHISQLNFLLVAVKPLDDAPVYRVGF